MPILAASSSFTHNFGSVFFDEPAFDVVPSLLASLASYHGVDNAHLRFQDLDASGVALKVEEDTTVDAEMAHSVENVVYLAIGGQGPLTSVSRPLADGQTRMFNVDVADSGRILDVKVDLDVVHTRVGDLDILLESPDGTVVELLSDVGGEGDNLTATRFDDEAATSIASAATPFSGVFQPEGRLRDFAGKEVNGMWKLLVTDDTLNGHAGALLDWSIEIELAPHPAGNLNYDSNLNATDIDLLFANLGSSDTTYDLDGDGDADRADIDHLVAGILATRYGDADLDRDVDISDFNVLAVNFDPLGQNTFASWSQGNFDGDSDVDISDLFKVVTNFAPLGVDSTPETMRESTATPRIGMSSSSTDSGAARVNGAATLHEPLSVARRSAPSFAVETADRLFQPPIDRHFDDEYEWKTTGPRRRPRVEHQLWPQELLASPPEPPDV